MISLDKAYKYEHTQTDLPVGTIIVPPEGPDWNYQTESEDMESQDYLVSYLSKTSQGSSEGSLF